MWRYYLDLAAEDYLFVRNRVRLGFRFDGRHYDEPQPNESRPRITADLQGLGYVFSALYAPFTRRYASGAEQRERQYNLSLSMFPAQWPITTLTWDRLTRSLDHVPDDSRNTFTFSLDYPRRVWQGRARLLHELREFDFVRQSEKFSSALLDNRVNFRRRYWGMEARYLFEYTQRNLSTGFSTYSNVNNLAALVYAQPHRKVSLSADYDGRFAANESDEAGVSSPWTQVYTSSARAHYRPMDFLETALVHYRSGTRQERAPEALRYYTQVQVGATGRVLLSLAGTANVYRTWNHQNGRDVLQDAAYVRVGGYLWAHTDLSLEASYADAHSGLLPRTTVRSASLHSQLLRDSRLQVQYSALGSSVQFDLLAVEQQNVNLSWQQDIGSRSVVTVGWSRTQDRPVSPFWRAQWFATGSVGIRRWAMLSGTYNRLPEIVVKPAPVPSQATPKRVDLQLTVYPESRWVWNFNWYSTTASTGAVATYWGGTVQYRL